MANDTPLDPPLCMYGKEFSESMTPKTHEVIFDSGENRVFRTKPLLLVGVGGSNPQKIIIFSQEIFGAIKFFQH